MIASHNVKLKLCCVLREGLDVDPRFITMIFGKMSDLLKAHFNNENEYISHIRYLKRRMSILILPSKYIWNWTQESLRLTSQYFILGPFKHDDLHFHSITLCHHISKGVLIELPPPDRRYKEVSTLETNCSLTHSLTDSLRYTSKYAQTTRTAVNPACMAPFHIPSKSENPKSKSRCKCKIDKANPSRKESVIAPDGSFTRRGRKQKRAPSLDDWFSHTQTFSRVKKEGSKIGWIQG